MRSLTPSHLLMMLMFTVLPRSSTAEDTNSKPVRLASGISGHIHPAVCISKKGTIVVVFSKSDMKDLRLTRSTDGGKTWSDHVACPPTEKLSIYPGSLTTLSDGRIVHAWNNWYVDDNKAKSRFVSYSVSEDDGKTWSEAKHLPKNPSAPRIIRHPFLELGPDEWLCPFSDQTIVYNPKTEKVTPFGNGHSHGLVPMVRTPKGTYVSGSGMRSMDQGKTWEKINPFPPIAAQGWRHEMMVLDNGLLLASDVQGPGVGGEKWRWIVSRDDGKSWDFDGAVEFYNPNRAIGGRACPRTIQIDKDTIGTVFYDTDAKQVGAAGVFFLRTPIKKLFPR